MLYYNILYLYNVRTGKYIATSTVLNLLPVMFYNNLCYCNLCSLDSIIIQSVGQLQESHLPTNKQSQTNPKLHTKFNSKLTLY